MTNSTPRIASSLILLLILVLGLNFSKAAEEFSPVVIEKVEAELVKPDRVGGSRGSSGSKDQKWLLVEFNFTVSADKENKTGFLDEVEFKVVIEGRDNEGSFSSSDPVFLSGDVTYMCIPVGARTYGSFYVAPDVVSRYRIDRFLSQLNVNVQAVVKGQPVNSKDRRRDRDSKADWWAGYPMVPGMVFNKNQSVFILNDIDRYPTIKPKQGN